MNMKDHFALPVVPQYVTGSPGQARTDAAAHAINCHDELVEALEWYGEQARLARLVHSEGDAGRKALADDGGARARAILNKAKGE